MTTSFNSVHYIPWIVECATLLSMTILVSQVRPFPFLDLNAADHFQLAPAEAIGVERICSVRLVSSAVAYTHTSATPHLLGAHSSFISCLWRDTVCFAHLELERLAAMTCVRAEFQLRIPHANTQRQCSACNHR